ncbi:MAG: hypothetical protein AAB320_00580, partial [Elusimicrobiota bacterium]
MPEEKRENDAEIQAILSDLDAILSQIPTTPIDPAAAALESVLPAAVPSVVKRPPPVVAPPRPAPAPVAAPAPKPPPPPAPAPAPIPVAQPL